MMPWPPPEQPARSATPPVALTAHPVNPLPPRITPPAVSAPARRLPPGTWVFVPMALAAGSRWGQLLILGWVNDLPRAGGLAGMASELTGMLLRGLVWPRWNLELIEYRLPDNVRTLLFLGITVWLLSRLAARPAPSRAYQAFAVFGAVTVSALAAVLGGAAAVLLVTDDPILRGAPESWLPSAVFGAFLASLAYGPLLAWWATTRRGAGDRRDDGGRTR
ncbi:hypothetical protein [Micromonospora craterilacus]|uniref:hypothetical protein n=1 Tax=Micromonospora craterilacus TaxID=1655439 RepID=UPI0011B49518|nr:hypothetical protein [Micromonospora craterilacus]